jgi:Outer membrane protein beta-barrel domain
MHWLLFKTLSSHYKIIELMKYFISFVLALSILNVKAQKKISFDLLFGAGTVFSESKPVVKYSPGVMSYDPNTGTTTYISFGSFKTTNQYKNVITPTLTLGVLANYPLSKKFQIYAGVSFRYLAATRKNVSIFPHPLLSNTNYEYTVTESFKFNNLNIPFGVSYNYNKWLLNIGITPTVILNSTFTQIKGPEDPEFSPGSPQPLNPIDPKPSPNNKTKSFASLSVSPLYQLSDKVKIGIEYDHALTNSYSTDMYSENLYQSMKTRTLCLKFLYKLTFK